MGMIFQAIMRKFGYHKQRSTHILSEEDRQRSIETRRLQAQVRNLEKQAELQLRLGQVSEVFNPKEKPEEMLLKMLMAKMMTPQEQPQQQQENNKIKLSEEKITELINSNLQYVKHAKKLSDEQIKEHLLQINQNLHEESIKDITQQIRVINGC